MPVTQAPVLDGTATRLGRELGRLLRVTVALVLLGGLLGAALGAAPPSDLDALAADLDSGRVTEIEFSDSGAYEPGLRRDSVDPVVRWRTVGAGWQVARLDGTLGDRSTVGGWPADGSAGTDVVGSGPAEDRAAIRVRAQAAGVPIVDRGPDAAHRLVQVATVLSVLLVLVLIGSPQPRRATKWAWFWLMLLPGGLGQLAWIAVEAPWSTRANRRPEPLPHNRQPDDTRLTGGPAFLLSVAVGLVLTVAGWSVAGWLTG